MQYVSYYTSPIGRIVMCSSENALTGLWFEDQKYFAAGLRGDSVEKETPVLEKTRQWLDIYFSGRDPEFTPELEVTDSDFRRDVWEELLRIPYGKTLSYLEIAKRVALKRGLKNMSAQAVGGAVGHNPISLIIPCHRVIGADGSLTGYAGGLDKKKWLLESEAEKEDIRCLKK